MHGLEGRHKWLTEGHVRVEGGAHGRGGRMGTGKACPGGKGGAHDGSLHQFQGVTVWLGAPLPKCLNEYTCI
jgi:hypothetical protein